jgi:hypothetical protein
MVRIFQLPFSSDNESSDGEGCYNYKGVTASLMIGSKNYVDSDGSDGDDDSVEELCQTARTLIALPRPPVGRCINDESELECSEDYDDEDEYYDKMGEALVDKTMEKAFDLHLDHICGDTAFDRRWGHIFNKDDKIGSDGDAKGDAKRQPIQWKKQTTRETTPRFQYR